MRLLVSGTSGLLGSAMIPAWRAQGHEVLRLVRTSSVTDHRDIPWGPPDWRPATYRLDGVDAVVHLAGAGIAERRWSAERKKIIYDSRIQTTGGLAAALAALPKPPSVVVIASAVGYYGDRGDEMLVETSSPGEGFLPSVCTAWEAAAEPLRARGIRVVHMRFGIILSRQGGALRTMLAPYRFGLGGRLGSGKQYMSWITLEDAFGAIRLALRDKRLSGPVNVVAPAAVTQEAFNETLARVLHRPAPWTIPAPVLRLALGEMADALLLSSMRAHPQVLKETGYPYLFPDLKFALTHLLR